MSYPCFSKGVFIGFVGVANGEVLLQEGKGIVHLFRNVDVGDVAFPAGAVAFSLSARRGHFIYQLIIYSDESTKQSHSLYDRPHIYETAGAGAVPRRQ